MVVIIKIFRRISLIAQKNKNKLRIYFFRTLNYPRFQTLGDLEIGKYFSIFFDVSESKILFGRDILFRDSCTIRSGMGSNCIIGDRVFFNNGCSINCFEEIIIGNDCLFGEGVKFYDHNHNYKNKSKIISGQGYSTGSIKIGKNCWFGSNVIILKNVTVGDNVVIGANCVIHKSIPSGMIVTNKQNISINSIDEKG